MMSKILDGVGWNNRRIVNGEWYCGKFATTGFEIHYNRISFGLIERNEILGHPCLRLASTLGERGEGTQLVSMAQDQCRQGKVRAFSEEE